MVERLVALISVLSLFQLSAFAESGSRAGISAQGAKQLLQQLNQLNAKSAACVLPSPPESFYSCYQKICGVSATAPTTENKPTVDPSTAEIGKVKAELQKYFDTIFALKKEKLAYLLKAKETKQSLSPTSPQAQAAFAYQFLVSMIQNPEKSKAMQKALGLNDLNTDWNSTLSVDDLKQFSSVIAKAADQSPEDYWASVNPKKNSDQAFHDAVADLKIKIPEIQKDDFTRSFVTGSALDYLKNLDPNAKPTHNDLQRVQDVQNMLDYSKAIEKNEGVFSNLKDFQIMNDDWSSPGADKKYLNKVTPFLANDLQRFLKTSEPAIKSKLLLYCESTFVKAFEQLPTRQEIASAKSKEAEYQNSLQKFLKANISSESASAIERELNQPFVYPTAREDYVDTYLEKIKLAADEKEKNINLNNSLDGLFSMVTSTVTDRELKICADNANMIGHVDAVNALSEKIHLSSDQVKSNHDHAILHEFAHAISKMMTDGKLSERSAAKMKAAKECLLTGHGTAKNDQFIEEDFADLVGASASTSTGNFFCQAVIDEKVNPHTFNLESTNENDVHSTIFFRLLSNEQIRKGSLPEACLNIPAVKAVGFKNCWPVSSAN